MQPIPRWWQLKYFQFSSLPGDMIQFDEHIFQMCWFNHQLVYPPSFKIASENGCLEDVCFPFGMVTFQGMFFSLPAGFPNPSLNDSFVLCEFSQLCGTFIDFQSWEGHPGPTGGIRHGFVWIRIGGRICQTLLCLDSYEKLTT